MSGIESSADSSRALKEEERFGNSSTAPSTGQPNVTPTSEDRKSRAASQEGGRLQFYLDGKIVLELNDRRENGKTCWVQVTQKTYWPPLGSAMQDSGTSFSRVDDSPAPSQSSSSFRENRRKNLLPSKRSSTTSAYFLPPAQRKRIRHQWNHRRRPFRPFEPNKPTAVADCLPSKVGVKKDRVHRLSVSALASLLLEKVQTNNWSSNVPDGQTDSLVSPRKRLLRDLEKVSIHGGTTVKSPNNNLGLKKAKAKAILPSSPIPTCSPSVNVNNKEIPSVNAQPMQPAKQSYDRHSSYSIDSLLNSKLRQEATNAISSSFLRSLLRRTPSPPPSSRSASSWPARTSSRNRNATTAVPSTQTPLIDSNFRLPMSVAAGCSTNQRHVEVPLYRPTVSVAIGSSAAPVSTLALDARPRASSLDGTSNDQIVSPFDDNEMPLNLTINRSKKEF